MSTTDLLLIGAAGVGLYLIFRKDQKPQGATTTAAPTPTPSVSPYWGYPPNIMNPSPAANTGQSWTPENTTALITGVAGITTAAIGAFK
jgi:hypothetical protein